MAKNAELLAEWICSFTTAGSSGMAFEHAKDLLLDHLGVLIAGSTEEQSARVAYDYARAHAQPAESTLLEANAQKIAAEAAAFAHAAATHSIEMDDVHNASSSHPGVVSIPAALSIGEAETRSGAETLAAIVVGYETILRVGEAAGPSALYRRGFHPTAVCGVFSSAAAAGRMLGLDRRQMTNALGLAWSFASGSMSFQTEGSWAKRLQVGNTVRAGIQAAKLAANGATGPAHVFEENGFFHSYSGAFDREKLLGGLGEKLKIAEVGIKPFACCRYNQTPVDALLELRTQRSLTADAIDSIDIEIASTGLPLVAVPAEPKRQPTGSVEAQFSLYYSAAVALVAGAAGRGEYREPWLSDRRVLDLARRVHVGSSDAIDAKFPDKWAARVRVKTKSGEQIDHAADDCLGDPEKPLGRAGIEQKFKSLTAAVISPQAQTQIIEAVTSLQEIQTADLIRVLTSAFKARQ